MGFRDRNFIPGFISQFRPIAARKLENHAEETFEKMMNNWDQGKDAKGRQWEPLAPSTIAQKGHSDPLIEDGDMYESADYEVNRSNLTAEIYIEDEKIGWHEYGTERIPARPVLRPAHDVLVEELDDTVGEIVDTAYRAGGGR